MISIFSTAIKYGLLFLFLFSVYALYRCYKNNNSSILYCLLVKFPQSLDGLFRTVDSWLSRSYDHKQFTILFINGHPKVAIILIFLAVFFLIGGLAPSPGKVPITLGVSLIITVLISHLAKRLQDKVPASSKYAVVKYFRFHALHFVSSVIILSLSAWIWFFLAMSDSTPFFYKHIHIPVITVLIAMSYVALISRMLIFLKLKNSSYINDFKRFSGSLNNTQLVWPASEPVVSWATAVYGVLSGPSYHVLKLLLLPSIIVIFLPTAWINYSAWFTLLGFSWLLLALCTVHRRMHFVLSVTNRWFLTGGQLIVSLLIISLAIGRICDISYVSTLLDGVPFFHVLFFVLSAYSSLWLYEYWSNSILCNHLLDYLRSDSSPDKDQLSRVRYTYTEKTKDPVEYFIQLYSGARFSVIEEGPENKSELKTIFEKREIFGEISKTDKSLVPLYSDLSKRIMLYFTFQNFFMISLVVATVLWIAQHNAKPMINATRITSSIIEQPELSNLQKVDLKKLVLGRKPGNDKHVIFLAASGGGTRAAIYTTSLLAALQEIGKLDNVVLASGVSGGGMSLAYLSANRDKLINNNPENCANDEGKPVENIWCKYINAVSDNHIMQVASRIGETQIFIDTSLGQFLADSFKRSFYDKAKDGSYKYVYLDQLTDLGLILNTSLIAQPYSESDILSDAIGQYEKKNNSERLYKIDAGGRLIFTNIQNLKRFPWDNSENLFQDAKDVRFKYVIAGGKDIPLHTIGALTANFPPVFPNAIVKLGAQRFSVSDGGAVENRGLLSLMFAIRSFIEEITVSGVDLKNIPTMHIVMAEGSGVSIDYSNYESGLTAIGSASVMIGNQLALELKSILKAQCGQACADKLQFHYLNMPLLMRARGGLGTHWKMPSRVPFELPSMDENKPDDLIELTGTQTICLMQELFAENIKNRSAPIIDSNLTSEGKHIQCGVASLDKKVRSAFLSDKEALQKAWRRLKLSLEK